jgi:hypothetical protein
MVRNDLLIFAQGNPSVEQIEGFILQHPELDSSDLEALRAASNALQNLSPDRAQSFRAVNNEGPFRAVDAV